MKKKLIGLLLALALVIGLLPVMAMAAESTPVTTYIMVNGWTGGKISISKYDTPVYMVNTATTYYNAAGATFSGWNVTATGANADNWNIKAIWNTGDEAPTLYLRGAKVDWYDNENNVFYNRKTAPDASSTDKNTEYYMFGGSSSNKHGLNFVLVGDEPSVFEADGYGFINSYGGFQQINITSEGNAKMIVRHAGFGINNSVGVTVNANIDMAISGYNKAAFEVNGDLIINGGNINLTHIGTTPQAASSVIAVDGADHNVIINGGNITASTVGSANNTNAAIKAVGNNGKVIVNGGNVRVEDTRVCGYYGKGGVEINGGSVYASSSYYGFGTGPLVIKGGTVESDTTKGANAMMYDKDKFDISGYACFTAVAGASKDEATAIAADKINEGASYYKKYVKISAHTVTEVKAKEASCKEDGNIAYWTCAKCGKYYSDAAGATEITDKESVKISKDTVQCKPEADDGDCTTAIKCSVCGKETTPANAAHTAGTWTDGKTNCTVCNKEFACTHTGGTATCEKKAVCTTCGEEYGELAAHTPAEDDGDCTTAVKCTVCGEDARPAGTHVGGTATCKAKAKCTNCGQEYGELAAHTPAEDDGDCSTAIKCTVCGAETTAAKTHVEEKIPGKPATTTETGLTEGKKCSTCGKILVAQKEIAKLPASGTNGNPATGDSHIAVWMGLMAVSAAAFVSIVVIGKKKIA